MLTGSNRRPTPCKGAALPTELRTQPKPFASVQRIFQCLAWTKLWNLGSLYFNRYAGTWITPGARCTFAYRERTESNQRNRATFLQRRLDGTDRRVQRTRSGCLGDVGMFRNMFNQFGLVHKEPLVRKERRWKCLFENLVTKQAASVVWWAHSHGYRWLWITVAPDRAATTD